jgi:hypothetical protein
VAANHPAKPTFQRLAFVPSAGRRMRPGCPKSPLQVAQIVDVPLGVNLVGRDRMVVIKEAQFDSILVSDSIRHCKMRRPKPPDPLTCLDFP